MYFAAQNVDNAWCKGQEALGVNWFPPGNVCFSAGRGVHGAASLLHVLSSAGAQWEFADFAKSAET